MNNANVLAQINHVIGGYALLLTVGYFTHSWIWLIATIALGIILAAVKEFWYDANYELPVQTDGDNWLDFSMYMLGLALGGMTIGIKHFITKHHQKKLLTTYEARKQNPASISY